MDVPSVTSELLVLGILYALLAGLLLALLLLTRWAWWVKGAATVLVSVFYIWSYQAWVGLSGWPSEDLLPKRFVFLSAVFDEPRSAQGHTGAIYIWVHPLDGERLADMPRAYRLPYEKDLRRLLDDGMKKARDGNTQLGSLEPKRGISSGSTWLRPSGRDDVTIKLSDVPRAQLPEK